MGNQDGEMAPAAAAAVAAEAEEQEDEKKKPSADKRVAENGAAPAADPLDKIVKLMQDRKFDQAVVQLKKLLREYPEDPILLHNLAVIYTEQGNWEVAEETFMSAFESQKTAGKYNYATLFGLATVLTEQGGTGKLLQAEALFRDCLVRAIEQEENGILETYRTFTSLAENLGLQKRWSDAAEAYQHILDMGVRMYGEEHQRNEATRAVMARAQRLARMQKYMRIGLWGATFAVPVVCAWMWKYMGGPSVSDVFRSIFGLPGQSDGSPDGDGGPGYDPLTQRTT